MNTFGVLSAAQLKKAGFTPWELRCAVALGRIERLRHGWYALEGADPEVVRAVRLGGALSCSSGLARYGVWVPSTSELHVRCSPHHVWVSGVRSERGCSVVENRDAPRTAVDPLPLCIAAAWKCLDEDTFVAALDSIQHLRLLSRAELHDALSDCGPEALRMLRRCRASESGTETLVRLRLRRRRIRVRTQVFIPGVGRVDLLLGRRLVIEVDSRAHHTDAGAYQRDRDRDRALVAAGYLVIRLTYQDVMFRWEACLADIVAIINRGDHRRRR